jgi:hypothetical protein
MRLHLPFVAAACLIGLPAQALDMPARKPGLWEIKMVMEGRSLPPQITQHCVDAATDKQMSALGAAAGQGKCSQQDLRRTGNTMIVDSVCQIGSGTATSHAEVTGSFDSAYTMKVTSKMGGAATAMTIDAKWLGACKADQKPGDIIMANGIKMNIVDMQKLQGTRPGAMPAR